MNYRKEIDGLRAVAILPVIFFHAGFDVFSGGFIGVDVFFVISGYLIASIILEAKARGTFTLAGFYERRARRILPPLFVMMLFCLPCAWLWLQPNDMTSFCRSLVAVSLFGSNIFFWKSSGYFGPTAELNALLHTWSLAVEEQYYFLFPAFLLLTWQLRKRWQVCALLVIAGLSLAIAQWGSSTHPSATFFLLPTRGWELLVGVFVAFHFFGKRDHGAATGNIWIAQSGSLVGILLISYAVFAFSKSTPFPSLYTLVPTVGTACVIMFATPQTLVGTLLGSKLLAGLGLISYGTYLWHQPLFAFAKHRSLNEPSTTLLLALCVVAIGVAYISWKFVETPVRNRVRCSSMHFVTFSLVAAFVLLAFGLVGHLNGGYPNRFPDNVNALSELTAAHLKQMLEGGCDADIDLRGCVGGGPKVAPSFARWGDSHAAAIAFELGNKFGTTQLSFVRYTKPACPTAMGLRINNNGCEKYSVAVFEDLMNRNISTVIVSARWQFYSETSGYNNEEGGVEVEKHEFVDIDSVFPLDAVTKKQRILHRYKETLLKLVATGKKIILIYPVPEVGWNVPTHLAKLAMWGKQGKSDLTTSYSAYMRRNKDTTDALDGIGEHPNLVRIRPERIFCDTYVKSRCVAQLNGVPLYFDDDHLSNAGARLIVDQVMKYVGE